LSTMLHLVSFVLRNRISDINCQHDCDGSELRDLKILQEKAHTVSITLEGTVLHLIYYKYYVIRKMTFSIHITLEGTILHSMDYKYYFIRKMASSIYDETNNLNFVTAHHMPVGLHKKLLISGFV